MVVDGCAVAAAEVSQNPHRPGLENLAVIAAADFVTDNDPIRRRAADRGHLAGIEPKDIFPFVSVAHDQERRCSGSVCDRLSRLSAITRHAWLPRHSELVESDRIRRSLRITARAD
jgi:hypothetical protein